MTVKTMLLSEFGIDECYLAHTLDETLIAHSNLTLEYFHKIATQKNLHSLIDNLLEKIDRQNFDLLKEMFINTIFLHDIGKTNPYFQAKKMDNEHFQEYKNRSDSSEHSSISSQMFIEHYLEKIKMLHERTMREKFKFILYMFSYHQAKHHAFFVYCFFFSIFYNIIYVGLLGVYDGFNTNYDRYCF